MTWWRNALVLWRNSRLLICGIYVQWLNGRDNLEKQISFSMQRYLIQAQFLSRLKIFTRKGDGRPLRLIGSGNTVQAVQQTLSVLSFLTSMSTSICASLVSRSNPAHPSTLYQVDFSLCSLAQARGSFHLGAA